MHLAKRNSAYLSTGLGGDEALVEGGLSEPLHEVFVQVLGLVHVLVKTGHQVVIFEEHQAHNLPVVRGQARVSPQQMHLLDGRWATRVEVLEPFRRHRAKRRTGVIQQDIQEITAAQGAQSARGQDRTQVGNQVVVSQLFEAFTIFEQATDVAFDLAIQQGELSRSHGLGAPPRTQEGLARHGGGNGLLVLWETGHGSSF